MDRRDENRFMSNIYPEPNSGCWLWDGELGKHGYGIFSLRDRYFRAHRISYELLKGPIPGGLVIDHLCRVIACVNPDHLEAVTQHENMLRSVTTRNRHGICYRCGSTKRRKPRAGRALGNPICPKCTNYRADGSRYGRPQRSSAP